MRFLRRVVPGRVRFPGSDVACVLSTRATACVPAAIRSALVGRRGLHTVESIRSRLATVSAPIRVPERSNVRLVKDHAEFYSAVYSIPDRERVQSDDLVVSVFVSQQNTASLSVLDCVDRLSREYPGNKFLVIDADQVPRAAYDADLQQFPAALLSFGGDVYRRLVQETNGYPSGWQAVPQWELPSCGTDSQSPVECTLPEAFYTSVKREIESFAGSFHGQPIATLKSRSGTHSYTHGIDTDNLNVKRVGWPTE
ncbi:RNA-binding protein, putative [Babesia ovata]|uniref:RNA-binding protein, putative n=1 Tax=Babesia ovata TaxID=189622 RepID=A0A2H6K7Z7_9APIC|nr:RNA-binding protein, putative [Babesia ovata]GBE59115.1 RNA-binding protein, putative [Babesia ovata]